MVQFKGTKGKWVIASTYEHTATYVESEDRRIAEVKHYEGHPDKRKKDPTYKKGYANALLISKAPEMLEMLERARKALLTSDPLADEIQQLLTEATKID